MPGDQDGGVGLQNHHASFFPEFTAKQNGHKYHVGYNIAAAAVNVAWHEYATGHLEIVVQNSVRHNDLVIRGVVFNDWFSAYVLPWGIGKVARMEIPNQSAIAAANKVRAFFTAEMNGCAFLAAGDSRAPVLAHLNVNAITFNTQAGKETELERMVTSALKTTRGGPNIANKTGAVVHWKQPATAAAATTGVRLAKRGGVYADGGNEIANFDLALTQKVAAEGRKFYYPPTTDIRLATMGVMDAGNNRWQFFYQRNFCTTFATVKKIGAMGVVKNIVGDWRNPRRENYYARIVGNEYILVWPIGAGIVNIPAHGDPTQA